ncbi:hypothetical protein [Tsuneonella troitsensis]|uniref:hypothetical protein n=1 Tax=Tsuneonella troitsensis TaxID=292222 RepID=UPI000709E9C0|nr:hypothetical protein [Tsuneonella troitsensis]
MIRVFGASVLALLAAACSQEPESAVPDSAPSSSAGAAAAPPPAEPALTTVPGRAFRFTSLEECRVVRQEVEEMPYTETLCPGPGGWAVRISDSDARQSMTLEGPYGAHTLPTSRISGGAFSSFGPTAEWRGDEQERFTPDSLIVRYNVAEEPYPAPETSYLLAVKLGSAPCIVAKVAPGPGQNDSARKAADGRGDCLAT